MARGKIKNIYALTNRLYKLDVIEKDGLKDILLLGKYSKESLEHYEGSLLDKNIEYDPVGYTLSFYDSGKKYKLILRFDGTGNVISGAEPVVYSMSP